MVEVNNLVLMALMGYVIPRLHLTVLTTGTKPDVCENGFPSFKTHAYNFQQTFYPLHKLYIA